MEYGTELLYEAVAIIFFFMAVTLIFSVFKLLNQIELETKRNIYEQHVLYSNSSYD